MLNHLLRDFSPMNRMTRWGLLLALAPLAACASNPPPATPAAPPAPPPLSSADANFVQVAAQGGMAEVQLGQLADQTSKNSKIKMFAEQMVKDHTAANDQLKQLATAKGATVPTSLSDEQNKSLTMLGSEKGHKFDRDYAANQVQDHTDMLGTFQTEAASGTDPDLKSFAAQTVPTIQQHLTEAKKLSMSPMHHKMMKHHHQTSAS